MRRDLFSVFSVWAVAILCVASGCDPTTDSSNGTSTRGSGRPSTVGGPDGGTNGATNASNASTNNANNSTTNASTNNGDPCADVTCAEDAECVAESGQASCECLPGFNGDGQVCEEVVACDSAQDCDENAQCVEDVCTCNEGWTGDGEDCRPSGFERAVAGRMATCGIRADATMWCWGIAPPDSSLSGTTLYDGIQPRPAQESSGSLWVDVSPGWMAVRQDGSLWEHGNLAGWRRVGLDFDWERVAGPGFASNALRPLGFRCGLKSDGSRWCWGENSLGQLGDGTTQRVDAPARADDETWSDIAVSAEHGCGVRADGTLWCWGETVSETGATPEQIGTDDDWERVFSRAALLGQSEQPQGRTCAMKSGGGVYCWGGVDGPQVPTSLGGSWTDYAIGSRHECGVRDDGTLWCQGRNLTGERGDDTFEQAPDWTLRQVGSESNWVSVTAGTVHTCAVKSNSETRCFGQAYGGLLGDGVSGIHTSPTLTAGTVDFTQVDRGLSRTCAVDQTNTLQCAGSPTFRNPSVDDLSLRRNTFQPVTAASDVSVMSAGDEHTCLIKLDGTLWCRGSNATGQLGLGEGVRTPSADPVQVGAADDWIDVSCGGAATCGVRGDGTLWCWGGNSVGQLGVGDEDARYLPTQVGTSTDWSSVSTEGSSQTGRTCAVKSDGTLWCWGRTWLDAQSSEEVLQPEQVGTGSDWSSVDVGDRYQCGIRSNGTLWCWGRSDRGELGLGVVALDARTAPEQVGTEANWAQVATGRSTTCAVKEDGTLWCWGDGALGQLGNGQGGANQAGSPVQVGSANDWVSVDVDHNGGCAIDTGGGLHCWGVEDDGELGLGTGWFTSPRLVLD